MRSSCGDKIQFQSSIINWKTYHEVHIFTPTRTFWLLGEKNCCYLPESTETTFNLVKEAHPQQDYSRFVIPDYGHLDCIYGENAEHDVYPHILEALDQYAEEIWLLCLSLINTENVVSV